MKTRKLGEYFFGRYYSVWAVYQVNFVSDNGWGASLVGDERFGLAMDAMKRVYELNGWGEPKYYPDWMRDEKKRKELRAAWLAA